MFVLISSCTKELKKNNNKSYLLQGGIVKGYPPYFRLYESDLETIRVLNFVDYDLEIYDNKGNSETMVNGAFSKIIGESGASYTIKWKLKSKNKWHQFTKKMPNNELDFGNIIKGKNNNFEVGYNKIQENYNYYYGLKSMINPINYRKNFHGSNFSLMELKNNENGLTLWPLKKFIYAIILIRENPNYTCTPFYWQTGYSPDMLALFSVNKTDFNNLRADYSNSINRTKPLSQNIPIIFDYKENDNYALSFFINHHKNFDLMDLTDTITGQIKYNFKNLEPSKYELISVGLREINNNEYRFPSLLTKTKDTAKSGTLFFKDLIDFNYVKGYQILNENNFCITPKENYDLEIRIHFQDIVSKKLYSYLTPFFYDGKTGQTLTINIP